MKKIRKLLSFTATMAYDLEFGDDEVEEMTDFENQDFDDCVDCDYDNLERPINNLIDCGWEISDCNASNITFIHENE